MWRSPPTRWPAPWQARHTFYALAMHAALVVLSLLWFAFVMIATYRVHVLTRIREFFPQGRVGAVRSVLIAVIIWGVAFNVAWIPVIIAVAA
jgi:hypothetical protein